jgi:hypothetical protein
LHEDDGLAYAKIAALLRLSESSCKRYVRLWYKLQYLRPAGRARERNPITLEPAASWPMNSCGNTAI